MKWAQKRSLNMSSEVKTNRSLPWPGGQDVAGDVLNPAVGAEFDRADKGVGDEEDEQQENANREAGDDGDDQEKPIATADETYAPCRARRGNPSKEFRARAQLLAEEQRQAGSRRRAEPRMPTSLNISPKLSPFAAASDFGKFWPRNISAVEHVGMRNSASWSLPAPLHLVAEHPASDDRRAPCPPASWRGGCSGNGCGCSETASPPADWPRLRACRWPRRR